MKQLTGAKLILGFRGLVMFSKCGEKKATFLKWFSLVEPCQKCGYFLSECAPFLTQIDKSWLSLVTNVYELEDALERQVSFLC